MLELQLLSEQFYRIILQSQSKPIPYIVQLDKTIVEKRQQLTEMKQFWKLLCESLQSSSINHEWAAQDKLFVTGTVDHDIFGQAIGIVKGLFDTKCTSFYLWSGTNAPLYSTDATLAKDKFNISSLSQPNRSEMNLNIDSILKQNIRDDGTLVCSRCRQQTQIILPLDTGANGGDFQAFPPWLNAFQDHCFCGGDWTAFSNKR